MNDSPVAATHLVQLIRSDGTSALPDAPVLPGPAPWRRGRTRARLAAGLRRVASHIEPAEHPLPAQGT